jgi:hypothetical protein
MKFVRSATMLKGKALDGTVSDPGAPESLTDVTQTVEVLVDQRGDATCRNYSRRFCFA